MPKTNNPIFHITDFAFQYPFSNSQIKLDGEIKIYHNDIVLISGASGIGKSTLLYALKGLIPYVIQGNLHGNILYNNQNIATLNSNALSKIGLLLQNPEAQIITSCVIEELAYGLENLQLPREQILLQIKTYADKFNITHLLDKTTAELSTGEKQQINLISLLITQPEVLLLDEPTAFLDPNAAKHFIYTFNLLQNTTIIIIEHNLGYLQNKINRFFQINTQGEINEQNISQIQWRQLLTKPLINPQPPIVNEPILIVKNYLLKNKQNTIKNFELCRGDIIGIIGNNGVGKSTFLQALAGLKKLKNSIFLLNKDICKIKNYFDLVGLLWQNPENHFLYNTVTKELSPNVKQNAQFDFTNQLAQNPFTLSEGQKRRLSLAILYSLDRQIYLLDEPSFGQDLYNKQLLIQMIYKMKIIGKSFVIISHDYDFLQTICTQVLNFTEQGLIPYEPQ